MVASGVTGCYTILNLNRERTMNGTNNTSGDCRPDNSNSHDAIDLRKENTEFERRRRMVEEAKKLLLKAQKV